MVFEMKKITKKKYQTKLKDIYYFIGTLYNTNKENVKDLIFKKQLNKDNIINECKSYYNCQSNSVDFLHKNILDGAIMHETKKGLFYLIECNNITYLLHDYKDNTISVKAIL